MKAVIIFFISSALFLIGGIVVVYFIQNFNDFQSANEVEGNEAYEATVIVGDQKVDVKTETVCWTTDECTEVMRNSLQLTETSTNKYIVKSDDKLNVDFTHKPNTINLQIEEIPEYHEQWSYNGSEEVDIPNKSGTYTYNMLVYWHGEKAFTQGIANYRFSIRVDG